MSNGSKRQTLNNVGKSFIVDYRNAKYQGEVSQYDRLPHGMGMLLTIDYQLVIAHWEDGVICGQCVIFYPNGSIFYGNIKNSILTGVNIYQLTISKTTYSFHKGEEENIVIIDNQLKHTLTALRIESNQLNKLISGKNKHTNSEYQYYDIQEKGFQRAITTLESRSYSTVDEKWQVISNMSGETINNEQKSFKEFVKYHFNSKIKPKDKRLEIIQTKQYLEIRSKKAGIVIRLEQKNFIGNRIKLMGYFDCYEEQMDIFIKSKGGFDNQMQEYCEGHTIAYSESIQRNFQCKRNLINYFRKSTNFINRFIQGKYIESIKKMYQTIDQKIEVELSMKDAQQQLQMGVNRQLQSRDQSLYGKQSAYYHNTSSQIELQQIKNEVYNRINRKKDSSLQSKSPHAKNMNLSMNDYSGSVSRYDYKQNNEYFDALAKKYKLQSIDTRNRGQKDTNKYTYESYRIRYQRNADQKPSKYPKQYIKYTESSPNRGSNKRTMKYDIEEPPSKYSYTNKQEDYKPSRSKQFYRNNSQQRLALDLKKIKREVQYPTPTKYEPYSHLPKEKAFSTFQAQSLKTLTQNYEQIQNTLKQQKNSHSRIRYRDGISPQLNTPTSKSPSKYNYYKSPKNSQVGTPGRSKRQWR